MVTENKETEKRPSPGTKLHTNRDGSVVKVSANARIVGNAHIEGSASIEGNAHIGGNASVWDSASVEGYASVGGYARIVGNARVWGDAHVGGGARVWGNASIEGYASVGGYARIGGNARVWGDAHVGGGARVWGDAHLRSQTHLAWVDKVGSGKQMTLHRTYSDGEWGWQINAGCVTFNAPTVSDVCRQVKDNIRGDVPEWGHADEDTRALWRKQVKAALKYLASMVDETITDEDVASVQEAEVQS